MIPHPSIRACGSLCESQIQTARGCLPGGSISRPIPAGFCRYLLLYFHISFIMVMFREAVPDYVSSYFTFSDFYVTLIGNGHRFNLLFFNCLINICVSDDQSSPREDCLLLVRTIQFPHLEWYLKAIRSISSKNEDKTLGINPTLEYCVINSI